MPAVTHNMYLDIESATADAIAVGVSEPDGKSVMIGLEDQAGKWVVYRATPDDARAMALALLEKIDIVEKGERYAQV